MPDNQKDVRLIDALEERYLSYALSTIMNRALPDLRDGLKPVHRRLIYAMYALKLNPGGGFKKSARVVGDVIGKFHPHGEQAVYDALVRLAQDFSVRYPMITGQGNFGNIDGDNAAAMRYTEAKLTEVAFSLLDGIEEEASDFRDNYDGEETEPVILPGAFPNILANGAAGIAVGMATNIPPHNLEEICLALLAIIDNKNADTKDLLKFIKGPDFPTGGIIVSDQKTLQECYQKGKGSILLCSRWHVQQLPKEQWQIIITEIPYQVQKAKILEKIAELIDNKKIPLIANFIDESTENVRIVIEPRNRFVEPEKIMASLFRTTDLQSRFNINMNLLSKGKRPSVMSLDDILKQWLEYQKEVCVRKAEFGLQKYLKRIEILQGYLIVYINIDEVIKIIRYDDRPKVKLMHKFNLNELQVESILNMRLRTLRKLDEIEIKNEHEKLKNKKEQLEKLLGCNELQWQRIAYDIRQIKEKFGKKTKLGKRRTHMGKPIELHDNIDEILIEKAPLTITCSKKEWIKALKGHYQDISAITYKQGDEPRFVHMAQTTDKVVIFSDNGKVYNIDANRLPMGRGSGEPIRLLIDLDEGSKITSVLIHDKKHEYLVYSNMARGFITDAQTLLCNTRKGKHILNLSDSNSHEKAMGITPLQGDFVAVIGNNGRLLIFPCDRLPKMNRARGLKLQDYTKNEQDYGIADLHVFDSKTGLELIDKAGRHRKIEDWKNWIGERAQKGKKAPKKFPRNKKFKQTDLNYKK